MVRRPNGSAQLTGARLPRRGLAYQRLPACSHLPTHTCLLANMIPTMDGILPIDEKIK